METPHEPMWLGVHGWRRPRARWFALGIVLIIGCATALALLLWLRSYAPLAWRNGGCCGGHGTLPVSIVETGVSKELLFLDGDEPGTYGVGFDLTNTGRFAVRVDGPVGGAFVTGLKMGDRSSRAGGFREVVAFAPVEIAPGDARYIELQLAPQKSFCNGPGDLKTGAVDTVALRYSYLRWFHRTATVEMPFSYSLVCGNLPKPYSAVGPSS